MMGLAWNCAASVAGGTHDRVAVDALDAPECVDTGPPKGLIAALVADEAGGVDLFGRFARVGTEGRKRRLRGRSAHRFLGLFALAHRLRHLGDVQAPGPVTRLAAALLNIIAWMLDEDVAHHGRGEVMGRRLMTPHACLAADIVGDYRGPALTPDMRFRRWRGRGRRGRGLRSGSHAF